MFTCCIFIHALYYDHYTSIHAQRFQCPLKPLKEQCQKVFTKSTKASTDLSSSSHATDELWKYEPTTNYHYHHEEWTPLVAYASEQISFKLSTLVYKALQENVPHIWGNCANRWVTNSIGPVTALQTKDNCSSHDDIWQAGFQRGWLCNLEHSPSWDTSIRDLNCFQVETAKPFSL